MDFEFITSFFEELDPAKLIPELDSVLDKAELVARICVMAGPLILLVLGLLYFFAAPKEANHSFGYRFYWGMSSVEVWQFTQRLAGIVWGALGLILTVVMFFICNGFGGMEVMPMVELAAKCLLWEAILAAVACIGIDVTVIVLFNSKGDRRESKAKARE